MAKFAARLAFVACMLLATVIGSSSAWASYGKRFALVIGNSDYANVQKLPNAAHDAADIARALEGLRFQVFQGIDLNAPQFSKLIDDFKKEAAGADTVVFYYAGHGFQLDNANYLVPVDAQLKSRDDIDAETFALNEVIAKIHSYNRQTIILLDACRNNPLPSGEDNEPTPQGLAQLQTGDGIFVAFATKPGDVSVDGSGANSPFAKALLAYINTPVISVSDLMIKVRNEVKLDTGGRQLPWDQSSLSRSFSFQPEEKTASIEPIPSPRIQSPEIPNQSSDRDVNAQQPFKPGITISPPVESETMATRVPDQLLDVPKPGPLQTPIPEGRDLRLGIQKQLSRLNCLAGGADGEWNSNTVKAIETVNRKAGLALSSVEANPDTLLELKSLSGPLCITRCGKNQMLKGGICVARPPSKNPSPLVKKPSKPNVPKVAKKPAKKPSQVARKVSQPAKKPSQVARKKQNGSSGVTVGSGIGVGSFF